MSKEKINRIKQFLTMELWRTTGRENLPLWRKVLYSLLKVLTLTVRGFQSKDLAIKANGLTYSLTFAIVPILAMILAIAKGFGFDAIIEERLNHSFLGEMNLVPMVMGFVERYLDTTQGGVFIGIGLLILIWAVYAFFRSVELAFNGIWNVQQSRSIARQLSNYIFILFLVPILMVVTSGLSLYLNSAASSLTHISILWDMQRGFVKFLSYFIVWMVFTWIYWAIPNTKVRFVAALVPGVLMGTLFQLLQALSMYLIVFLSRTSIVYGAFASIPLLLMWLQWSCLLILIGAELSYSIQNREEFEYEKDLNAMSRRYKDCLTLYLLAVIIERFNADEPPLSAHEMAHKYRLPVRLVNQLLSRLLEVGVVRTLFVENNEEKTYQPALDTHKISVGMVFDRIDAQGTEAFLRGIPRDVQEFWERFLQMKAEHNSLNEVFVSELKR